MFARKPNPTLTLIQGQRNSCNLSLYLLGSLFPFSHKHTGYFLCRLLPFSSALPLCSVSETMDIMDAESLPNMIKQLLLLRGKWLHFITAGSIHVSVWQQRFPFQEHLPSVASYPLKRIIVCASVCVFPHSQQSWIIWSWTSRVLMCNMCPVIREHSLFPVCCECVSCRLRGSVYVCVSELWSPFEDFGPYKFNG